MIGSSAGTREHISSPEEFVLWKGAKVLWPVDMPDYIIDYVVLKSKSLLNGSCPDQPFTELAEALKKDLDGKWGPYWHVTVGNNFGSYVVHQKRRFVYFTIDHTAFLIYKAQ